MSKFNPDVPDLPEKSYLGLSKPISPYEGDQSGKYLGEASGAALKGEGALAAGAGQLFKEVVTGADETIKSIINDSVRKNVNDERGALMTQIQNTYRKNPSIFGDDSEGSGEDNVPDQVQSQTEGLENKGQSLKSGAEGGKFPLSYYSMRLESGLKELRDRFPGHVDYIDRTGERISGENSANKAWQRMLAEYNANANSGQRIQKATEGEARGYMNDGIPGAKDSFNKLINGGYGPDPSEARRKYYQEMSPDIAAHGALKNRNLELANMKAENEYKWKIAEGIGEDFALRKTWDFYKGVFINLGIEGADGNTAEQLRTKLERNSVSPEGSKMSEPEALKLKYYGATLLSRADLELRQMYQLPTNAKGEPDRKGTGPSLASQMGPEASKKIDEILKRTIHPIFTQAFDDFSEKKVTAQAYSGLLIQANQQATDRRLMSNDDIRRTMETIRFMKDAPDYLEGLLRWQMSIQKENFYLPFTMGMSNNIIEMHSEPSTSKVLSQNAVVDKMVSLDPDKTIYKPEHYKSVVDVVRGITDTKSNDVLKYHIARRAFFPENKDFLQKFTAGLDRSVVFNTLFNQDMTKEMSRLGENRPEYWTNYKRRGEEEFGNGILHQTIMDLSTIKDPNLKVSWNTITNNWQLELGKMPSSVMAGPNTRRPDTGDIDIQRYYQVRDVISNLNVQLNTLQNIGKADKSEGDVGNYLLRTMAAVNPDIAKMPGVPGDMYRVILDAKKAEIAPPEPKSVKTESFKKPADGPRDAPGSRISSAPLPTPRPADLNAPVTASEIAHYSPEESRKNIEALFSQFDAGTKQLVLDRKTGKYVPYEDNTKVKGKDESRVK